MLWTRAWAHVGVLERRKGEASRFRDFERDGDLRIVDSLPGDLDEVSDMIAEIDESGLLHAVGLDPAGVGAIVDALAARGIANEPGRPDRVVGISQGYRLMGAIKTCERKLADGTLSHPGQRMMSWCVGNAKIELRGNAIYVTKAASGTAKIDPLMATFCAVEVMSRNPESPTLMEDIWLLFDLKGRLLWFGRGYFANPSGRPQFNPPLACRSMPISRRRQPRLGYCARGLMGEFTRWTKPTKRDCDPSGYAILVLSETSNSRRNVAPSGNEAR